MTFHESYGELTKSLLRTIRKYNVSPSDYDTLVSFYGEDYAVIEREIVSHSPAGFFNGFLFMQTMT